MKQKQQTEEPIAETPEYPKTRNSELQKLASLFQDELSRVLDETSFEAINSPDYLPESLMSMLRAEIEKKSVDAREDEENSERGSVMISSLKERMQDMQQKLHDAKRALQENETNDGVVTALEDQIEKLRGELRDVKLHRNDLEQDTTTLNRMLKSETVKREDVEKKLVLLKEESDFELSETREQFESRLATMREELSDIQARADTSNKKEVEMSNVINGLEQENKAKKDECESLCATVDSMKAMIEKSRSQVNENVARIKVLEGENKKLVLEHDLKLQEKNVLISNSKQEIKSLMLEIDSRSESHKLEIEKYEGQLVKERKKVEEYKITVKEVTELNDRLKESLDQFKQNMDLELEQLRDKIHCQDELQERIEDYKNQIEDLNRIVGHLRDNSIELRELVTTLEKSVEDERSISRAEREIGERLQKDLDSLQNEFEESNEEINIERKMLEEAFQKMKENEKDLEGRLIDESEKHQHARVMIEKLQHDIEVINEEIKDVSEKMENEKDMYADTISSIEEANREKVSELEKELRESLSNRKTQVREKQIQIDDLKSELVNIRGEVQEQVSEIEELKDRIEQKDRKFSELKEDYEMKLKVRDLDNENLRRELEEVQNEFDESKAETNLEREMLESSIFNQMKENEKNLNMSLEEVEDRLLEESKKFQEARNLAEDFESDIKLLRTELKDANERLESEKSMYEDTISSIEDVNRKKVLELEDELRDSLNNRKIQMREKQMQIDKLNAEVSHLRNKFLDNERKIKTYDDDADVRDKKYADLREEFELKLQMKEDEYDSMNSDMKQLERIIRDLEYEKIELQTKMKRNGGSVVRENEMLLRKVTRMGDKIEEYKDAVNKMNVLVKEQMESSENLREVIIELETELEEEKVKNTRRQILGSIDESDGEVGTYLRRDRY